MAKKQQQQFFTEIEDDTSPKKRDILDVFHPCDTVCDIPPTNDRDKIDAFELYKPSYPGQYLDYSISQTEAKLDAGSTKIHLVQTKANYVPWDEPPPPPPPPVKTVKKEKKGIKYFHGGPPCWEFLDEIWARKVEKLQEMYKREAKERQLKTEEKKKKDKQGLHVILESLVGPDWYQELSPKQMKVIDTLAYCIGKDLHFNTIDNVKDCMAGLGLVLRPNRKHLKTALKYCCGCPVEFLLILYQISDPNRKCYSLNDKLLLSAVVHLTMMETLCELHVRIPSPPRCPEPPPCLPPAKPKRKKYKSPYLEPFTFKPDERRFSGIYKNRKRQYPESQYFSYIDELRSRVENYDHVLDELIDEEEGGLVLPDRPLTTEESLTIELQRAQESYERLNICGECASPSLKRATIYPQCDRGRGLSRALEEAIQIQNLGNEDNDKDSETITTDLRVAVELRVTNEYNIDAELVQQRFVYYVDIDEALQPTYKQCIKQSQRTLSDLEETFVIGGVSIGRDGKPVYLISTCLKTSHYDKIIEETQNAIAKYPQTLVLGNVTINRAGDPVYAINGVKLANACICEFVQERKRRAMEAIRSCKTTYILGGVCIAKNGDPVYMIQGVKYTSNCKCPLLRRGKPEIEPIPFVNPFTLKKERVFMVGGVFIAPNGKPVYMLSGITLIDECRLENDEEEEYYGVPYRKGPIGPPAVNEKDFPRQNYDDLKVDKMLQPWRSEWPPMSQLKPLRKKIYREETPKEKREREALEEEQLVRNLRVALPSDDGLVKKRPRDTNVDWCRKAVEKFIDAPRCHCDRCLRDLEERKKVFIVQGTAVQAGEPIQIITGMSKANECQCLERYLQKIADYDERKRRHEAYLDLKSMGKKYVISGVTTGPDGQPIYILSNVITEKECKCEELNKKEKERLRNMPEPLPHDGRYIISGIRATPEGNIYVVSGVQPFPDCQCMKLYDAFMEQHTPCMELYEAFIRKVKKDMEEYMEELKKDERLPSSKEALRNQFDNVSEEMSVEHLDGSGDHGDDEKPIMKLFPLSDPDLPAPKMPSVPPVNECVQELTCFKLAVPKHKDASTLEVDADSDANEDQEITLKLEVKKKKKICTCDPKLADKEDKSCKCEEKLKKKKKMLVPRDYKRYILLPTIPCELDQQLEVIRQALVTMAEDGYPLAKLPECHRLPHFELWMKWRCGFYVSQDDRWKYLEFSKKFWAHTETCVRKFEAPKLKMTKEKAATYTWASATKIKEMTSKINTEYYRKLRQVHIADGREFFPTVCDYDLPTRNFRDCYFAYVPYKEEESFAWRPWYKHEYKEMRNARVCI